MSEDQQEYLYLLDTNVLSSISRHPDVDELLAGIFELAIAGQVKTIRQVFRELEKYKIAFDKIKDHKPNLLIPTAEQMDKKVKALIEVVQDEAPYLSDPTGAIDAADPWLVAVAKAHGYTLVTDEKPNSPIKIPAACQNPLLKCRCIQSPHFLFETKLISEIKPEHVSPELFYK